MTTSSMMMMMMSTNQRKMSSQSKPRMRAIKVKLLESPYLSDYESIEDISICTVVTAIDLSTGETIILKFGQGLWFGDRMSHSLLNPNQRRIFGLKVG